MPPSQPPRDDLIGQTIAGRYRIISRLGAGGMGVAYRAWDGQAGLPVVIKIPKKAFLEDPTFAERFAREIRLLQGLDHPHVVPIVDVGEHDGLPFVVMRFLPGGSLSNRRLRGDDGKTRPNPPGMLHLWLPAVAEALDFVNDSGVVHRDVKPANIFFDAFWGAFLGDFGIAKVVAETDTFDREATLTATSMGVGTPDYMAPELFEKKAKLDGRTDQYALAIIAYEMLAGTRPFTGDFAQVYIAIATQQPPRLDRQVAGLPASAVEAVHRGLAKRPADRFASCRQFAAALLRDIPRLEDEPDTARFLCPSCSNLLKLPTAAAGRKGKCPKCKDEMKVADDLGALWLLDEVERQQAAGSGATGDTDWTVAQEGNAATDAVPEFTPISTTKPKRPKARRRRGLLAWINGHGLAVAALLGLATLLPWLFPRPSPSSQPPKQEFAALQSLQKELENAGKREADLRDQLAKLQASQEEAQRRVDQLQTQLADASRSRANQPVEPVTPLEELTNSVGIKFKLIPAGTFIMGSEFGRINEKPVHEVSITKPFYLGVTEVTNAEWMRVMGSEPPSKWKGDDQPVEQVSWDDAVEFCKKLSEMQGERIAHRSYRLPTEAEWEYACRAGSKTRYSFGDDEILLGDFAWFGDNSGQTKVDSAELWRTDSNSAMSKLLEIGAKTHEVRGKQPNRWGLFDTHGNVWEWCSDWQGNYPQGIALDPQGPTDGKGRIRRGGSWNNFAAPCSSSRRGWLTPATREPGTGFRLALSPSDNPPPEAGDQGTKDRAGKATEPAIEGPSTPATDLIPVNAKQAEILAQPPLENSIGMKLKLIPAGTFMMGSEAGEADEKPVHEVRITKPFYLGVTEVTNAQWRRVMGGEPPSKWKDDERPVETVSWNDAVEFCRKLSELHEEQSARRSYRLPTESEWEYACRAETKTLYSCGDDAASLGDFAWFKSNSGDQTHPVGQKKPNQWGLHDMHGNVWEWCSDWYGPYAAGVATNPTGPDQGSHRVNRGGSWGNTAGGCRSAPRDWHVPSIRIVYLGFRLALSPSDSMTPEAIR
jgi:formylglycine-generating enzyme required for sulfatase activity/serine/threonine protein kinase